MDTFLYAKLGKKNIKSSVKNTDNLGLTDNGTVALSKIGNEVTQVEMCRLLLGKGGRIPFAGKEV